MGGGLSNGNIFKIKSDLSTNQNLIAFSLGANGHGPLGSLISKGTFLYGMTHDGGTSCLGGGCGVLFKINSDGSGYSKLHDFGGANYQDGNSPYNSLIACGTYVYGMTTSGGTDRKSTRLNSSHANISYA